MDKYNVVTDEDEMSKTAAKSGTCPKCGSKLTKEANCAHCPKCGTAPFEGREEKDASKKEEG
jgi:ribosomal protein S27AE